MGGWSSVFLSVCSQASEEINTHQFQTLSIEAVPKSQQGLQLGQDQLDSVQYSHLQTFVWELVKQKSLIGTKQQK